MSSWDFKNIVNLNDCLWYPPIRVIKSVAQVCRLVTRKSDGELLLLCVVDHWWVGGRRKGGHLPLFGLGGKSEASFWKVARESLRRKESGRNVWEATNWTGRMKSLYERETPLTMLLYHSEK